MDEFLDKRKKMVKEHLVARGIRDQNVLNAMEQVPREFFVDKSSVPFAYEDRPLPIGEGQTISQPFIVALMAEQAQIDLQDKVLEIGTGSGYAAAILSQIASHVYSIESIEKLALIAGQRFKDLGYQNTTVLIADGTIGWIEFAPYNVIIVTAASPKIPPSLLKQLAIGGRLIIPVGSDLQSQQLIKVKRNDVKNYSHEIISAVRFVPLIGKEGW